MTKYFKGSIIDVNDIRPVTYNLDIVKENEGELASKLRYYLDDVLKNGDNDIINSYVNSTINEFLKPKNIEPKVDKMIYEKISDNKGNYYGREVITGLLFPIKNETNPYDVSYSHGNDKEIYYDEDVNIVYSVKKDLSNVDYCLIGNNLTHEFNIPSELLNEMYDIAPGNSKKIKMYGSSHTIKCIIPSNYVIEFKPKEATIGDKKLTYAITNEEVANQLDVYEYFELFENGIFRKRKRTAYYKLLHNLCTTNKLGNFLLAYPHPKENKTLVKK